MVRTTGIELVETTLQCYRVILVECKMVSLEEWLLDAVRQEAHGTHQTLANAGTVSQTSYYCTIKWEILTMLKFGS